MTTKFETTCDRLGCGKRCDDKHLAFVAYTYGMATNSNVTVHACSETCAVTVLQNMAQKIDATLKLSAALHQPAVKMRPGSALCAHCLAPARYTCECPRCAREPDDEEKYHTCNMHKTEVAEQHLRVRDREPSWKPR